MSIERSEQIGDLAAAMAKAQAAIEGASKDKTNPHFKSAYADLASVWDACREALTTHGIVVLQPVTAERESPTITVTTILLHTSGQFLSSALSMTPAQNTPQAMGSCITYARRYGLAAMVGVAPEDDDGNAASEKPFKVITTAPHSSGLVKLGEGERLVMATAKDETSTGKTFWLFDLNGGEVVMTWDERNNKIAEQACQDGKAVTLVLRGDFQGKPCVKEIHFVDRPKPRQPSIVADPKEMVT